MHKIEIDTFFGDKLTHVEIAAPHGTGAASYHITIDKYYNGEITKTEQYGWQIHLHPKTILTGDDVSVIIGLIEQNLAVSPGVREC